MKNFKNAKMFIFGFLAALLIMFLISAKINDTTANQEIGKYQISDDVILDTSTGEYIKFYWSGSGKGKFYLNDIIKGNFKSDIEKARNHDFKTK